MKTNPLIVLSFATMLISCAHENKSTKNMNGQEATETIASDNSGVLLNQQYSAFKIVTSGVLQLTFDTITDSEYEFFILNPDGTTYGIVKPKKGENHEPYIKMQNGSKNIEIRAYYPDFHIIHFDCNGLKSGKYEIIFNGSIKYIAPIKGLTSYYSWDNYLGNCIIKTHQNNPLRCEPIISATEVEIDDYNLAGFNVLNVRGEWIKVRCDNLCSTCSFDNEENIDIVGWIRWKKGNILLIELFYSC